MANPRKVWSWREASWIGPGGLDTSGQLQNGGHDTILLSVNPRLRCQGIAPLRLGA